MSFLTPLNESVDITLIGNLSDEELLKLFRPLIKRINELGEKEAVVIGFAIRRDSKEYIQMVEMEPAFSITPYFKPKASRYKNIITHEKSSNT